MDGAGPGPAPTPPPRPHPQPQGRGGEGGGGGLWSAAGVTSRWRPPKPPDAAPPAQTGTSLPGATTRAPDTEGAAIPPPPPPFLPTADEWLPPRAFLPLVTPVPAAPGWTTWRSAQGLPPRPLRSGLDGPGPPSWGPQRALDALTAACAAAAAADQVYDSMDALAAAWHD